MLRNSMICAEYIKNDVKKLFINQFNITNETDIKIITSVLDRIIARENISSYSLKEYYDYQINRRLVQRTKVEYDVLKVLSKYLKPRIIHHLYKYPNGLRFKKLKIITN